MDGEGLGLNCEKYLSAPMAPVTRSRRRDTTTARPLRGTGEGTGTPHPASPALRPNGSTMMGRERSAGSGLT